MLPDKLVWAEEFTNSERYLDIVNCINAIPEPPLTPLWDLNPLPQELPSRHHFYMRRFIPLRSFYIIDYINTVTNGGNIVNMCEGNNYFAGMYNIKNTNGTSTFINSAPYTINDRIDGITVPLFDNAFSVCENYYASLEKLETYVEAFANCIKYSENGGYGYIAFNSFLVRAVTPESFIVQEELNMFYKLNLFVDAIFERMETKVDVILYENDIQENPDDGNPVDGDIRFFFRVKPSVAA